MNKAFTIAGIIGAVIIAYIWMLPMWPIITSSAFTAANTVNATANAYDYRATTAFLRWSPLMLIFVPAAIATVAIFLVLKRKVQQQQ